MNAERSTAVGTPLGEAGNSQSHLKKPIALALLESSNRCSPNIQLFCVVNRLNKSYLCFSRHVSCKNLLTRLWTNSKAG
jgi:hypothetical protein